MDEELNKQVDAGAGAVPEGTGAAKATSSEATTEPSGVPDVKAQIEAAVQEVIKQYEDAGGHIAKMRSKYDTKIADLERRLTQQRNIAWNEAKGLMDKDPAKAAQLLATIVQAQAEEQQQHAKRQELGAWQRRVMTDLGYDLDGDEEAASLATDWASKLLEDPNLTWDFQQEIAMKAVEKKEAALSQAQKELDGIKSSLAETINAEVTRALVKAGIVPDTSPGGDPQQKEVDWREKSDSSLVSEGIRERTDRAVSRT